jgi:uncharacterized membrane protein
VAARPAVIGAVVLGVAIVAWMLYVRTRAFGAAYWIDEGLSIGIARHGLFEIPGVLRQDGSPPLYYVLLHFWTAIFGTTEHATHALSLVFSMAVIPAGMWAAWSLFGRRAALLTGVICAGSPFLTAYAQETRMYSLLVLLSVLCTTCFLHAFVNRRRNYLPWFAITLVAMLYTHLWSAFFVLGIGATTVWLIWRSKGDERRGLRRDALLGFGGAGLLYLPWVPTALSQLKHTAAPWAVGPTWRAAQQIPRTLVGSNREAIITAIVVVVGMTLTYRARKREETGVAVVGLVLLAVMVTLAWTISHLSHVWVPRYFAIFLGPLLLLMGWAFSRAGVIGIAGLVILCGFWFQPHTPRETFKSNVKLVAADGAAYLRPGDLVVSTHPEQIPLIYYYMQRYHETGLRYATELGYIPDPQVMNWRDAVPRLDRARVSHTLRPMLNALAPGRHLYLIRPVVSRKIEWTAPWTALVKKRTFQWIREVHKDPRFKQLHVSNAWLEVGHRNGAVRGEMYVKTRR